MTIKQTAEQLAFVEANKDDFWVALAIKGGATIEQCSDGRWLVGSPEGAEKVWAECRKSLRVACQLWCCKTDLYTDEA